MKAITILQPWASLIACGAKKIETRRWATKYRGQIAIHAGKSDKFRDLWADEPFYSVLVNEVSTYRLGHVIAVAELIDCVLMVSGTTDGTITNKLLKVILANGEIITGKELEFGHYGPDRYAWILTNVRQIEPVPAKGMQRLWEWEP